MIVYIFKLLLYYSHSHVNSNVKLQRIMILAAIYSISVRQSQGWKEGWALV